MRFRSLIILLCGILVIAMASALRNGIAAVPPPGAQVRVLTTEPLRIKLTPTPSASEIAESLTEALLERAESERDPTMRGYLEALGKDGDYISGLAGKAVIRLDGEAGALAYQLLHVDIDTERVAIAAVTAELLPQRSYLALTTAHEDGHALINDQVALRCGPAIAREALERQPSRIRLRATIMDGIYEAGDAAHAIYHREVNSTFRNFQQAATTAMELATERHC